MFSTRWGVIKISQSLNSVMAADVRRSSLSSLRYEDQVEVRLPLATLWVVLRNQLLIAWHPHPNVDGGWPAAVGDGVLVPPPRGERHHSLLPGPFGFSRPLRLRWVGSILPQVLVLRCIPICAS